MANPRIAELQAIANPSAAEIAELRDLLANQSVPSNDKLKATLEGYGYYAGSTHNCLQDGTEYDTVSFELSHKGVTKHIVMALGDGSVTAERLSLLTEGSPVHVSFFEKKAGEQYTDKDGNTQTYRTDGYLLVNISKASKAVVDNIMFNKTQQLIDTLRANGMSMEDIIPLLNK